MQNKNLKTVSRFLSNEATSNEWAKQMSQLAGGSVGEQPAMGNFANLSLLKALVLPFWCLRKTNLKGCSSEN